MASTERRVYRRTLDVDENGQIVERRPTDVEIEPTGGIDPTIDPPVNVREIVDRIPRGF
jgi:hypothetical protein